MRFCDHGGAAEFYKRGICRGIWVKIDLDLLSGRVGFLIKIAQRAVPPIVPLLAPIGRVCARSDEFPDWHGHGRAQDGGGEVDP